MATIPQEGDTYDPPYRGERLPPFVLYAEGLRQVGASYSYDYVMKYGQLLADALDTTITMLPCVSRYALISPRIFQPKKNYE